MKRFLILILVTMVVATTAPAANEVSVSITISMTAIEIAAIRDHFATIGPDGAKILPTDLEAKEHLAGILEARIARIARRYVEAQAIAAAQTSGDLLLGR